MNQISWTAVQLPCITHSAESPGRLHKTKERKGWASENNAYKELGTYGNKHSCKKQPQILI